MDTARLRHAVELRERGEVREALAEFLMLRNSAIEPEEKASLLLNEASCYRLLGQFGEAREHLSCALRMCPDSRIVPYVEFESAVLTWYEGDARKALQVLDRISDKYREHLQGSLHRDLYERIYSARGVLLTELTRYAEAATVLEESLAFDPGAIDRGAILYNLGLCRLQVGRTKDAKATFEECALRDSDDGYTAKCHYYLGTIYFEEAAFARAFKEFESCVSAIEKTHIPSKHIYQYLARTARFLGMDADARHYEALSSK